MTPSWPPVAREAAPSVSYVLGYDCHGLAEAPHHGKSPIIWRPMLSKGTSRSSGAGTLRFSPHLSSLLPRSLSAGSSTGFLIA